MPRPRTDRVWLKRRKNPVKNNGTSTLSFTLQYRDGTGREQFRSLGTNVTEEQAEQARKQLQLELTGPWANDPSVFSHQFQRRFPEQFEYLCSLRGIHSVGSDEQSVVSGFTEKLVRPMCDGSAPAVIAKKLTELAASIEGGWASEPADILRQFERRYPNDFVTLLVHFRGRRVGLLQYVEELCITCYPERVVREMAELAAQERWNATRFQSQFKTRFPQEYRFLSDHLTTFEWASIEKADKSPAEVALELLRFFSNHSGQAASDSSSATT